MYAKIICDNKAKRSLEQGWGFSCFFDGKLLFDAGPQAEQLTANMSRLIIDPLQIKSVVISHDHWDHTGGLWEILRIVKGVKVYACRSFSEEFKKGVKELGGKLCFASCPTEISKNIFVTGGIEGEYKGAPIVEQSLVIRGDKGVSIVTGCAHPGIVKIVKTVRKEMNARKIYLILGGFHMEKMDSEEIKEIIEELKKMGISKVGPCHCTGDKARRIFKGKFHDNFIPVKAGHIVQF